MLRRDYNTDDDDDEQMMFESDTFRVELLQLNATTNDTAACIQRRSTESCRYLHVGISTAVDGKPTLGLEVSGWPTVHR